MCHIANKVYDYIFVSNTDFANGKLTGAHRRFIELVKGAAKKTKILVISNVIPQLLDEECINNITFIYLDSRRYGLLPHHIETLIKLTYKLKSIKNINYNHAIAFGPVQTIAYWLAGYHHIVSLFRENLIGYSIACNGNKYRELYSRIQELIAVRVSEKIFVQCNDDKKKLIERTEKYCKTIIKKIAVQINNCNVSWMKKGNKRKAVGNDIPKILFVGDFSAIRKGHQLLLPAVAKLLDEGIECVLYVCGDGKSKNEWQDRYKSYQQIIFCGYVKTDDYLTNCDFMIVPSLIDSCPNTILEALNAGMAVYGANTGGIPELLVNQEFMFNPDIDSIYFFLKKVIINKLYINDAILQKKNRDNLTFDWADKLLGKIAKSNS